MSLPAQIFTPFPGAQTTATIQLYDPVADGPLAGSNVVAINATNRIHYRLPSEKTQMVRVGLNPSAFTVPALGVVGELDLSALDFKNYDTLRQFNGNRCIVTLTTSTGGNSNGVPGGVIVITEILADWTPNIEVDAPEGEGISTVSARGVFRYYWYDNANGAGSSATEVGTASGYSETT